MAVESLAMEIVKLIAGQVRKQADQVKEKILIRGLFVNLVLHICSQSYS